MLVQTLSNTVANGRRGRRSMVTYWAMEGFQGMLWHQKPLTDPVMLRAIAVQWGFVVIASFAAVQLWRRRFLGT